MVIHLNTTLPNLIQTMVRNKAYCVSCGTTLTTSDFRSPMILKNAGKYEVQTTDVKFPMWIHAKCPMCRYQTALWKMLKPIQPMNSNQDFR